MQNRFFDEKSMGVLLHPERWNLVSTHCTPDVLPFTKDPGKRWRKIHNHAHAYREILIPLTGKVAYGLDGRVYPCMPGTVMFFDCLVDHDDGYPPLGGDFVHLWLGVVERHLSMSFLMRKKMGKVSGVRMRRIFSGEDLGMDISRLWSDLDRSAGLSAKLTRMRLVSMISLVVSRVVEAGYEEEQTREPGDLHEMVISAATKHIQATAGKGVSLDSLARMAGYSKFHFHRMFKEHMGRSIQEYVDYCRIEKAEELRSEGVKLKDVSDALGFSCPSAFSRWYRTHRR